MKRTLDEATKNLIRARRKAGLSLQDIADELTTAGVPTLTGHRQWYPAQIQRALKDPDDTR